GRRGRHQHRPHHPHARRPRGQHGPGAGRAAGLARGARADRAHPQGRAELMLYLSTRGHPDRKRFCEILLEGLAPDGGLYLPERYPQVDGAALQRLRGVFNEGKPGGYAALAFEILSLYIDDIPADELRALCERTYTAEVFGNAA